jgi:phosphoglycolate phosphatase-like HAD superfamily hydrolase
MLSKVSKHIVWDWNGTLFDDAHTGYLAACEVFAARGLPWVSAERYRAAYTRPIQDFYIRLFGRPLAPGEFDRIDEEFHDAYRRALADVSLATGARETLRDWRESGGTQSLLSMFRHDGLLALVRRLGIEDEFARIDGLVGPGGGRKAAHLAAHLAALQLDPAEVVLVGDSLDDADAAAEVGASCILFNGGYHDRAALAVAAVPIADSMADALPELLRWATELRRPSDAEAS